MNPLEKIRTYANDRRFTGLDDERLRIRRYGERRRDFRYGERIERQYARSFYARSFRGNRRIDVRL